MEHSSLTLSIRLIRSFEHRNLRNQVLHNVDPQITTEELHDLVKEKISTNTNLPPPFKKFEYDAFKIETQAHGFKTNDPVINCSDDENLILKPNVTLSDSGVKNETELSYFKLSDYLKYKENPTHKW
ncbi:UPF0538 protein C2orf76 homolog isoform X2 [Oratosquilla oratoria]